MKASLWVVVWLSVMVFSGNVFAAGEFIKPISGWDAHPTDTYDTFQEDSNHPCNSNH